MPNWNYKLLFSAITAAILATIIVGLLVLWWDSYATFTASLGVAVGWAVGIVLAPYEEESKKFQNWSKAFTGFVGGITLTKLEEGFRNLSDKNTALLAEPLILRRIGVAVLCFIITTITVFVFRSYHSVDKP